VDFTNHFIIIRVVNRFWDTTNTLHLTFGEITTTPFDFTMLIGLGFIRKLLGCEEDFHVHRDQLVHLFGSVMGSIPTVDHFSYSILEDLMNDDERWA